MPTTDEKIADAVDAAREMWDAESRSANKQMLAGALISGIVILGGKRIINRRAARKAKTLAKKDQ